MRYLGIDLGTTYSCISELDELGTTPKILEVNGSATTPSVVWFRDDGTAVVGSMAKRKVRSDPDATVELAKRFMGTDKKWTIYGKDYTPVNISAIILKELFSAYKAKTSDPCKVVITCPANYTASQRELVKEAAKEAGIDDTSIINEPTAAALSYAMSSGKDKGGVLIYDLGGGTLDVTALYYDKVNNHYEVMASDGKVKLGGADWDQVIEEEMFKQLAESTGKSVDDLKNDVKVYAPVRFESENIKKSLSTGDYEEDIYMGPADCFFSYSVKKFEADTAGLLDSSLDLFASVLSAVEKNKDQHKVQYNVDAVVLVGGSSYMPQVKSGIIAKYPQFADKIWVHDPDHAISEGAAYYARISKDIPVDAAPEPTSSADGAITTGTVEPTKPGFTEVLSTTFGTDVEFGNGVLCDNLLFKNDVIPSTIVKIYTIQPGQSMISNKILLNGCRDRDTQPTCPMSDCQLLGDFDIKLPQRATKREEVKVTFIARVDGTIYCEGECMGVISKATVSPEDIKANLKQV